MDPLWVHGFYFAFCCNFPARIFGGFSENTYLCSRKGYLNIKRRIALKRMYTAILTVCDVNFNTKRLAKPNICVTHTHTHTHTHTLSLSLSTDAYLSKRVRAVVNKIFLSLCAACAQSQLLMPKILSGTLPCFSLVLPYKHPAGHCLAGGRPLLAGLLSLVTFATFTIKS